MKADYEPKQDTMSTELKRSKRILRVKVIHVATGAHSIPPKGAGGSEKVIYFLTEHLSRLGCDVGVIDIKAKEHQGLKSGVTFHEVREPLIADKGLPRHVIRLSIFAILAMFKLRHLVKNNEIDIIHTHSQFSAAAILFANKLFHWNIPHIHTTHNSYIVMRPTLANKLKNILEVIVFKKATHIIAQTDTVRQQLTSEFNVSSARITVIPNGIELEDITEFVASNPVQGSPGKVVLCPARICPRKNQLSLLKAIPIVLNTYPEVKFVFVGPIEDKAYFDTLHKFAANENLSQIVQFTGEVPRERLYQLYQNAAVFALPTLYESGLAAHLEAMTFGLPVVISRIATIENTVESEKGSVILIDPNNPNEIAATIIQVLGDETLRQELANKGKKLVWERFNWQQIATATLNLYNGLKATRAQKQV